MYFLLYLVLVLWYLVLVLVLALEHSILVAMWTFLQVCKAKTEQIHLFFWVICASSTAIFRYVFYLIEYPGILANCKLLSIKLIFYGWIDRWQPDRSHLHQFLFSVCQLELASKSWWYCTFQTAVWSGIFCVILVFVRDICVLTLSSWSVELISGTICGLSLTLH